MPAAASGLPGESNVAIGDSVSGAIRGVDVERGRQSSAGDVAALQNLCTTPKIAPRAFDPGATVTPA